MSDPNFPPPPPGGFPPAGSPPPPPGTPPPPGGFGGPPVPPGGFNTPPPPGNPPGGGYGGGYGGAEPARLEVGAAIGYGWKKFSENVGAFILLILAVLVVNFFVGIVRGILTPTGDGLGPGLVGLGLAIIAYVITMIIQAGVYRAGLGVTRGTKPSVNQLFETGNMTQYIVTSILIAVGLFVLGLVFVLLAALLGGFGVLIGFVFLIVTAIPWMILTTFAPLYALENGLSGVESIKASIDRVKERFGEVFLILFVTYLVYIVGVFLCCIGLFVTIPISLVAIVYTFRALNNETVTP